MTFTASAEVYDRHVGRYGPALGRALVEAAGLPAGARALDVGCGPGVLTRVLAERLGPTNVAAVDPSEPFAAACRDRVPGAEVQVATAESLPFPDDSFDAAFAQLVLNFLPSPEVGVAEMRRVTRPGAVIAACVWDYPGEMTMLRAFWDAACALDPAAPDEGATMPLCRKDELGELFRRSGLPAVEDGALVVEAEYADFDDYWSPFPTGLAPSGAYCASLDEAAQAELRRACFERLGSPRGPFALSARAWYAAARVD